MARRVPWKSMIPDWWGNVNLIFFMMSNKIVICSYEIFQMISFLFCKQVIYTVPFLYKDFKEKFVTNKSLFHHLIQFRHGGGNAVRSIRIATKGVWWNFYYWCIDIFCQCLYLRIFTRVLITLLWLNNTLYRRQSWN